MGFIMQCDTSLDDAYVEFDFTGINEVYVTISAEFDAAALALFTTGGGFSGGFAQILAVQGMVHGSAAGLGLQDGGSPEWIEDAGGTDTSPAPVADVQQILEIHYQRDVVREAWVDSSQVATAVPDATLDAADTVRVGQISANNDPAAIVRIDNVKIGTTRGGGELLDDNFNDGTFDAWTSTYGDVSLIAGAVNRRVILGQLSSGVKHTASVYFDNVKVGSTLGGIDYIDEDFEGGF